ncbi:phage tail tip lysozyme [Mesorhizobium sp. M0244]|uniref:phage tail tip lysozyme n=1 Tax=Mesorhizobium sp. M0244 TaxID=2956926 RepID=UPI00333852DA
MRLTEAQVVAGLTKRGVPTHVAQGVAMNFRDESGFDTGIVGDNGNAIGLAQWNGQRKANLESFAASQGKSVDDGNTQLDFFMKENAGPEAAAWAKVMAAPSAQTAAVAFVNHWERPRADLGAARAAKYNSGSAPDLSSAAMEIPEGPAKQVQLPDPVAPSLWQTTKDAVATNVTNPFAGRTDTKEDPGFVLTPDRIKADFEARGLPVDETNQDYISTSHSEAHYQENLNAASVNNDRIVRLSQAGMTGAALQITAQMLDPIALGTDIVVGSLAPELVLAKRGYRIGRVLAGAVGGGLGALASEGVKEEFNPNHQKADLFYGAVMGIGIGGMAGGLMRNAATVSEGAMVQRAAQRQVASYEDSVSGSALNAGSVGAAKTPLNDTFLKDGAFEYLDIKDMQETAFGKGRVSLSAYLHSSENVVTRGLAGLVQDGVGKKGGAINAIAASEDKDRLVTYFSTNLGRVAHPQLKAFIKEKGIGAKARLSGRAEHDFGVEINKYLFDKGSDRATRYPKSVVITAKRMQELYHETLGLMKNPFEREGIVGRPVAGALDIKADANWSGPRYWDEQRLILAHGDYADGTIERLIEGSIKSAQADIEPGLATRLAAGFTKAIIGRAHGLEAMAHGNVGLEDMEELVQTLMNHGGLDRADADALLESYKTPKSDVGRDATLKRRMLLDETYRLEGANAPMTKLGTADEKGLSIMDLLSQDAVGNFNRYIRPTMGRVSLSRYRFKDPVSGELLVNGITSDGEWRQLIDKAVQKNGDLRKAGKITLQQGEADIKRLNFAYSSIMGRPVNDVENTAFGHWGRLIRKFNFARIMNQVGFAQVSEVGMPIAHLGVKASFSQMPAFRRIVSQDGETILRSGLADDIEVWSGFGGERLTAAAEYRFDDLTGIHDAPSGTWRDKAEHALNVAGRFTSETSGLTTANVALNRWTAASIVQRFADMAHGGKTFSAKRFADLGVDTVTKATEGTYKGLTMSERILKSFKDPGNFEYTTGLLTKKKVARAHFAKWADKEAAEAFRQAAYRLGTTIIQKNDIGNMAMWMSHPAAKLLMQFRSFMVGAYEKNTLKSMHMRDGTAAKALAATMGFAGLSYVVQSKIASIGRSDRDKYLDERLGWDKIGEAAFARAGASSIIPMLIDTGAYFTGQNALFSHTRTTGQASNMMFGNPTTGGLDDIAQAFRGIAGLAEDRAWSQEEARALARVLPFGNSLPVTTAISGMVGNLPRFAPRDSK